MGKKHASDILEGNYREKKKADPPRRDKVTYRKFEAYLKSHGKKLGEEFEEPIRDYIRWMHEKGFKPKDIQTYAQHLCKAADINPKSIPELEEIKNGESLTAK